MLNIRPRGFDCAQYCIVVYGYVNQIGNSFAKIINTKVSSKPCQTSEMELFLQVLTGFRDELRILPNI